VLDGAGGLHAISLLGMHMRPNMTAEMLSASSFAPSPISSAASFKKAYRLRSPAASVMRNMRFSTWSFARLVAGSRGVPVRGVPVAVAGELSPLFPFFRGGDSMLVDSSPRDCFEADITAGAVTARAAGAGIFSVLPGVVALPVLANAGCGDGVLFAKAARRFSRISAALSVGVLPSTGAGAATASALS
jgi:hypothetical protein